MSSEKHISEVLNWEDISQSKVTAIYAGVGSGKNGFVERLIKGEIEGQPQNINVLLITSRVAKVGETKVELADLIEEYIGIWGNVKLPLDVWWEYMHGSGELPEEYKKYEVDERNQILNKSVVCTYAKIEHLLKRIYAYDLDLLEDANTLFWRWFDVIAIDEIHSLVLDASYQSAPFHIFTLIKAFYERCKNPDKHMILMTGTPQPIENLIKQTIPDIKIIDLFDACINTTPKKIKFIEKDEIYKNIAKQLSDGKKIIYFYNGSIIFPKMFCAESKDIPEKLVASCFSDEEARKTFIDIDLEGYGRMVYTEQTISASKCLPPNIGLLLTTSRYKEGINIKNQIDYIYIDSHLPADVVQMSGRARTGDHTVYIVVDSYQYMDTLSKDKSLLEASKENVEEINNQFNEIKDKQERIEFIDNINLYYIRFNYFTNRFEFYNLGEICYDYRRKNIYKFKDTNHNKPTPLKTLVKKWFPDNVIVNNYYSRQYRSADLFKNKYKFKFDCKETYKQEQIDRFMADLKEIWGIEYKRLNSYLKRAIPNIEAQKCGKGKKKYRFVTIKKIQQLLEQES